MMDATDKVNILLVDDQPGKLLTYEVVLEELGETLIKASSAREALECLLRIDVAVILMDVSMPELNGFDLAQMIREHPRYKDTAIIFVSAVHLNEADYVRGYQMGAVDYVSAPVVAEILRAKVKVFVELHRKTRELEALNSDLERRVAERTEELRLANDHQTVLAREVDHRAKNALAVAQAIVRLTQAETIDQYVTAIEGRINALARAHALLSDSRWQGASLKTIVEDELAPYRGSGEPLYIVNGPDIVLRPGSAQAIALALHELATNAAKYGAFAAKTGKLALSWRADPLTISWRESGVPDLRPPTSQGFGTKVIDLSIKAQLGGRAHFQWNSDGLHCVLEVPEAADQAVGKAQGGAEGRAAGATILLVEDEPLVALMIEELIVSLGYAVAGPYATVAQACQAIDGEQFTGAILDINLAGELVFPVADILSHRQIPFIFTTGYGPERVVPRFAHIPLLSKPVEAPMLSIFLAEALAARGPESFAREQRESKTGTRPAL
ncbi:response regulator [Taklimakanibacter deserti]|uniref:response regulator n=1 Tax=Taklimakanibacter deserti TaxID=2267839 RepID=UPI0034D5A9F5